MTLIGSVGILCFAGFLEACLTVLLGLIEGKFCFESVILQNLFSPSFIYLFTDGIIIDTSDIFSLSNLAFVLRRNHSGSECVSLGPDLVILLFRKSINHM